MKMRTGFVTNSSSSSFIISALTGLIPAAGAILGVLGSLAEGITPGNGRTGEGGSVEGTSPTDRRGTATFSGEGRILDGQDALDWLTERGFLSTVEDVKDDNKNDPPEVRLTDAFWEWWDLPFSEGGRSHELQMACGEFSRDDFNNIVIVVTDPGRPAAAAGAAEETHLPEPAGGDGGGEVKPDLLDSSDLSLLEEVPLSPDAGENDTPEADPVVEIPQGDKPELPPAGDAGGESALDLLGVDPNQHGSEAPAEEPPEKESPNILLQGGPPAWEAELNNRIQNWIKNEEAKDTKEEGKNTRDRVSELNNLDRVIQVTLTNQDGSTEPFVIRLNNGVAEIKQGTHQGQPNVGLSLSRDFFESVLSGERKLGIGDTSEILKNLENIQDDGSVDTLLDLFDADIIIKASWQAHKTSPGAVKLVGSAVDFVKDIFNIK